MEEMTMRAAVGCSSCLAAIAASIAFAAPQTESTPVHLQGFYELERVTPTWRLSDSSPWYLIKNAEWVNPRLVKQGYVPVVHDSNQYYCLIDNTPKIGSHVPEKTFLCGDPTTVEWLVDNNYRPSRAVRSSDQAAGFFYTGP
jgi:hypothetical protein